MIYADRRARAAGWWESQLRPAATEDGLLMVLLNEYKKTNIFGMILTIPVQKAADRKAQKSGDIWLEQKNQKTVRTHVFQTNYTREEKNS